MKIEGERKRKKPQGTFRVTQTCRQLLVGISPGLSIQGTNAGWREMAIKERERETERERKKEKQETG